MPDELLQRLRRFHNHTFPGVQEQFQALVTHGQHPTILFIGCSDSRIVPYLLTGTGPGELFIIRNVGAFVPPYDANPDPASGASLSLAGYHGTAAAIEFAVLNLQVTRIVVCGHSHCGGVRALYEEPHPRARHLKAWLELGREAVLPVQMSNEALRRTEQRAVVLQLERLMAYPMIRELVEQGRLFLHGWHFVIEDGEVHVFDVSTGQFLPASVAPHSGNGPYPDGPGESLFNEIDSAYAAGTARIRASKTPAGGHHV